MCWSIFIDHLVKQCIPNRSAMNCHYSGAKWRTNYWRMLLHITTWSTARWALRLSRVMLSLHLMISTAHSVDLTAILKVEKWYIHHTCLFGGYSNASLRSIKDVLNTLQYELYLNGYSLSRNCVRATKRDISICSRAYHQHVSPLHWPLLVWYFISNNAYVRPIYW